MPMAAMPMADLSDSFVSDVSTQLGRGRCTLPRVPSIELLAQISNESAENFQYAVMLF